MEFTAAGLLMQSELLLISRDIAAINRYLPRLERCANFIETRRDPSNNLFLAGPAANLLAPSFAGWKKPDGTYGQAYLTGLSITYIAALDRLIEVEKLAGRAEQVRLHTDRLDSARKGLALLTTDEGYFIRSLDPDGTRHGVYGAAKHGYFEASPNHDAIAFRVVDDAQAQRIYDKIASIPGLRPHRFILPNFPSYDDMYEKPEGLWAFGTWVNGGHWSTCEARMILGYYRLGRYDDARQSMQQLLSFARRFRMDNPLVKCGSDVYQPNQPINLTYDAFGPPAAMVRGLFEYIYHADYLELRPHIPPGITRLEQRFAIRFGNKRLFLVTTGSGPITAVQINGKPCVGFDTASISLPYEKLPDTAAIEMALGNAVPQSFTVPDADDPTPTVAPHDDAWARLDSEKPAAAPDIPALLATAERIGRFHQLLLEQGLAQTYEAAHARLILECLATAHQRLNLLAEGKLQRADSAASQVAADQLYVDTASKLAAGLSKTLVKYEKSLDPRQHRISRLWVESN